MALGGCVAAPAAPVVLRTPGATLAPTAAPTSLLTTVAVPTAVPTPSSAPTAVPTPVPTAIPSPSPQPTPTPTLKTVPTPPALANAVDAAMQRAIQAGATPGAVVSVRHRGVQIMLQAYGLSHKYDSASALSADPIDAHTDTLYDLASITKLFTTTCVMRLAEQSKLSLDKPVATWMPAFGAGAKNQVTLRQLLTHTSGLPADVQLWNLADTPEARMQRELETPLIHPPDTLYLYSDLGLIAIGHLLELQTGARLDQVIHDMVTGPLGLSQTMYVPSPALKPRIAATEDESDPDRGMVWGEVDDPNAWALGGIAGHAGIFGTAQDLARFAQTYLQGGVIDGVRLLDEATVADMTRNQIGKLGWRGLGWELNASFYMGKLASDVTFGHTGYAGTSVVIDPRRDLVVVLLTNRVHPTADGPSINGLRAAVANAAMAAVDADAG